MGPNLTPERAVEDPREVAYLARQKVVRRRQAAAILAAFLLAFGYVGWKVGSHLVASTWLQANRFSVSYGIDHDTWRQGGVTTVKATAGWSPLESQITRADLRFVPWLHRVEELDLSTLGELTDAEISWLDGLTGLTILDLDRTRSSTWATNQPGLLTDATLARVGHLTRLKTLNIGGQKITDAGLPHLEKLDALEHLDLRMTAITDAGLERLRKLPSLKSVDLMRTKVTAKGILAFEAARPGIRVESDPPATQP